MLAEQLGETGVLARALNGVGSSRIVNGDRGGEDDLRRSIKFADEHGLAPAVTSGWSNLGSGSGEVRRYEVAEAALEHAIALAAEHDLDASRHYATVWLAKVRFERGDWSGAEALIASLPVGDPSGSPITRIVALTVIGRLRARRGDADPRPPLEEAARLAERAPRAGPGVRRPGAVCGVRVRARPGDRRAAPVAEAGGGGPLGCRGAGPRSRRWTGGSTLRARAAGPAVEAAVAWRALGYPYEAADVLAQLTSPQRCGRRW